MTENKYLQWLSSSTSSVYWHDSAIISELDEAIGNGAAGVTTNPFLAQATLHAGRDFWRQQGVDVDPALEGDARVEALMRGITGLILKKVTPFRAHGFGKGYCCAQLNPNKPGQAAYMIEQAKRYAQWAGNIVIKCPATRAGIEVYEECAALGYNVAATVSFTVPQVLAVGEAFQRGAARARAQGLQPGLGIAVLMVGRLDDYLRDVMQDSRSIATEADIVWSGLAAIKRAYQIFGERNYECVLMPAGCRGPYHITELAGARMIMSIAPKIAGQLAQVQEPFGERIQIPVGQETIERLLTMPEFVKAYEPDGMTPNEFITFGSTNRTLTQFCDNGWNQLLAMQN